MKVTHTHTYEVTDERLAEPVILRVTPPEDMISPERYMDAVVTTVTGVVGEEGSNSTPDAMKTWGFFGKLIAQIPRDVVECVEKDSSTYRRPADNPLYDEVKAGMERVIGDPSGYDDVPEMLVEPAAYITLIVKAYEILAVQLHSDSEALEAVVTNTATNPFKELSDM